MIGHQGVKSDHKTENAEKLNTFFCRFDCRGFTEDRNKVVEALHDVLKEDSGGY